MKKSSEKIKVLFLTYHSEMGGGETILLSLIGKLDRSKFEPVVVVPKKGQLTSQLKKQNVKTYIVPLSGYLIRTFFIPGMSPISAYRFYKIIKKIRPDIIHLNSLNLAMYALLPRILGIPVVATAHGSWDCIYFYQDIINEVSTTKILANTLDLSTKLTRRGIISKKKVETVLFGVDTDKFKPGKASTARKKLNLTEKQIVVTIVGRLDPVKDHLTFLRAAKIVNETLPKTTFLIVGSKKGNFSKEKGYQRQIFDYLKMNKKLAQSVKFIAFTMNTNLLYCASDIVVSSSTLESFGLVLAEASSCEIPVVTTDSGNQSSIIMNNKSGYLVPPKDPESLADKIIHLSKNKKLRSQFGKKGRAHIMANFNLDDYVKTIEQTYSYLTTNQLESTR